jgi:hypothetical protein
MLGRPAVGLIRRGILCLPVEYSRMEGVVGTGTAGRLAASPSEAQRRLVGTRGAPARPRWIYRSL